MSCIALALPFVLALGVSSSSAIEWSDKTIEIGEDVREVYVGYYGLGVSIEFTDKASDRIQIRYPSVAYGKEYEVKVVEEGEVINLYIFERGHEPLKSKQPSRLLINTLRMVADILERRERGECPHFVIKLPKRFEGHFRIEPIL
ncbi:MAG: hypothetical protein ACTSYX_09805 [Candidatus Thorarchaeota archaeon]